MFRFACKNLHFDFTRMLLCIGGVAASVLLILVIRGVFIGTSKQLTVYIDNSQADVLVSQAGVKNMHMASSIVPLSLKEKLEKVNGVKRAVPIAYFASVMKVPGDDGKKLVYIIGFDEPSGIGGPWKMAEGNAIPKTGEVVIPQGFAKTKSLKLNDTVQIINSSFEITGISLETDSMASTFVFLSLRDALNLHSQKDTVNYFLVTAFNPPDNRSLANLIEQQIPAVGALSKQAFSESDRDLAIQMGYDIIRAMSVAALIVGLMVIAVTLYTTTIERRKEYAVLKAIGVSNRTLCRIVLYQAAITTISGFITGLLLAYGISKLTAAFLPEVTILLEFTSVREVFLLIIGSALIAALLPAWYISRVDPMVVFKS